MDMNMLTQFSFYFGAASMLCASVFFFFERGEVAAKWRTSVTVAGLVTFIAFFHYLTMRDSSVWAASAASGYDQLTSLRYVDWLVTVPLQIVEFYLILKVVGKVTSSLFWQLLAGSAVMLIGGLIGELESSLNLIGFIIGMVGWLYVVYLIFAGGAAKASSDSKNAAVQSAFNSLKLIVLIGWAIYPIGYVIGNFDLVTDGIQIMNIVYNFADLINKAAFGLVIWAAAKSDS